MSKRRRAVSIIALAVILGCDDEVVSPSRVNAPKDLQVKYDLTAGNNLRTQIESAPNGSTITLSSQVYTLDAPIHVGNKDNLTIVGQGAGATIINTTSNFQGTGVFQIDSHVHNLTIYRMSIRGTEPDDLNVHAIYTTGAPVDLSGLTFQELTIENVGNGIAISGDPSAPSCDNVTIFGNQLANINARLVQIPDDPPNQNQMVWSTSGSGYGIQTSDCTHVRIANNQLELTDRHAIYVGHGSGPVTVEHNLMLNHFMGETGCGYRTNPLVDPFDCVQLTPLMIARTSNVYAAFNIIANPYTHAIGLDRDNIPPIVPATGIQLVGNIVVGRRAGHKDFYINNPEPHDTWGNRYYRRGVVGPSVTPEVACEFPGCESTLRSPSGQWANTQWIDSYEGIGTSVPDFVYVRKDDKLHKLQKAYGTIPDNWTYLGQGPELVRYS